MDFYASLENHFPKEIASSLKVSLEKEPTHCLLLNTLKMKEDIFLSLFPKVRKHPFVEHAFYYDKTDYNFGKSILHAMGVLYIQDASAMMPAFFLSPKRGDTCIDLCASPGGKSIDSYLQTQGEITLLSNDISYPRAKELSSNFERLGIGCGVVTSLPVGKLSSLYPQSFDNVLLDAPCSGSAMFRKNELAKEDWDENKVSSCASIQKELLENAYALLKPGGKLVYSTCSFSKEENEDNVIDFLNKHPDMELISLPEDNLFYRPSILKETVYLLPSLFEGEGQFIALLQKKGEASSLLSKKRNEKEEKGEIKNLASSFGLDYPIVLLKDSYYSLPFELPLPKEGVLRAGIKIAEKEKTLVPDHSLAHYLDSSTSIPLSIKEAKSYLHGESFPLAGKEGFVLVSYQGVNLGFVKIVKGVAKNHYPKGLRFDYSKIDY